MIDARAPEVPDAKPGIPADGKNEYSVCLDTWRPDETVASPGNLAVYVYYPEQRHQWGEHFFPSGHAALYNQAGQRLLRQRVQGPAGHCSPPTSGIATMMVKANTPGQRDAHIPSGSGETRR